MPRKNNVHNSLRIILFIAQLFGFFPIQKVLRKTPESLNFKWISLPVLSSVCTFTCGFLITIAHIRSLIVYGYDQFEMNGVIFYFCGSLSSFFFMKLAKEWKTVVLKWQKIDKTLCLKWPKNLNRRIGIISAVFFTLEAAEHVTVQANKFAVAVQCRGSFSKGFEHFVVNMSFPDVFNLIKPYYSAWLGVFLQMINTRMAFSWTFIDLFIILISCALASRFRQINLKIRFLKNSQVQSERDWSIVNMEYVQICYLSNYIDDKISYLVLLSFFTNFYFMIFQILGSLTLHKATPLEIVYYFISLSLLLLRLISVCLYGSWINEESKFTVYLLSTSQQFNNKEMLRFIDSLQYQTICLTGKKFFKITKSLILKIAIAVVTYELVVVKFSNNQNTEKPSRNSIC